MPAESTSQKTIISLSIGFLLLILLFSAVMVIDLNLVQPFQPIEIDTDHPVQWALDEVQYGSHHLTLTGWALIEGETPVKFDLAVILQDQLSGEFLEIPTTLMVNDELGQIFTDGVDYSHSGFLAKINRNRLNLVNNSYRVFLDYRNNDHQYFIDTGTEIGGQP